MNMNTLNNSNPKFRKITQIHTFTFKRVLALSPSLFAHYSYLLHSRIPQTSLRIFFSLLLATFISYLFRILHIFTLEHSRNLTLLHIILLSIFITHESLSESCKNQLSANELSNSLLLLSLLTFFLSLSASRPLSQLQ